MLCLGKGINLKQTEVFDDWTKRKECVVAEINVALYCAAGLICVAIGSLPALPYRDIVDVLVCLYKDITVTERLRFYSILFDSVYGLYTISYG